MNPIIITAQAYHPMLEFLAQHDPGNRVRGRQMTNGSWQFMITDGAYMQLIRSMTARQSISDTVIRLARDAREVAQAENDRRRQAKPVTGYKMNLRYASAAGR